MTVSRLVSSGTVSAWVTGVVAGWILGQLALRLLSGSLYRSFMRRMEKLDKSKDTSTTWTGAKARPAIGGFLRANDLVVPRYLRSPDFSSVNWINDALQSVWDRINKV